MQRRKLNNCLNTEAKIFNVSICSIVLGVGLAIILGLTKGLIYALCAGITGFILGGWISKEWYLGNIQRMIYRNFAGQKIYIDSKIVESHHRNLM